MTDKRKKQLIVLQGLQNNGLNDNIDIMTITGFMTDSEVDAHIQRYQEAEKNNSK